jgi:ABC-type polysaccharide/polyol phosphate export permease
MRSFWIQAFTSYKGLYDYGHPRSFIANVIIYPIITVIMFGMLGRYAISTEMAIFFTVGMTVSCMNFNIMSAITQSFANERWYSTLSLLYATNANRFVNYCSRWVLHYPLGIVSCTVSLIMIRLMTNMDFGVINWWALVATVLITNLSICAFAQFLGIFSIVLTEWLNTLSFALGVCFILSGIILPLNVLPGALQEIGKCLPMTNGLIAMRALFHGVPFDTVSFSIIREFITGIVYFAIGYFGFVVFEKIARRTGALETRND